MFDDVPQSSATNQPPVSPPNDGPPSPVIPSITPPQPGQSTPSGPPYQPRTEPVGSESTTQQASVQQQSAGVLPKTYAADQEMVDMFKRESLSSTQKIVLIIITVIVVGALIGGGVWLFFLLDPFSNQPVENTNAVENVNTLESNENINQPVDSGDADGDGLKDVDEKKRGTDPNNPDTDGDGLTDYEEIEIYATKPLITDTDGDGYADGSEIDNGYDPNGPGKLEE